MNTQEITISKTIHSDASVSYRMTIQEQEIRLKKYQYEQMKGMNVFKCIESDLNKDYREAQDGAFWLPVE